MERVKTFFGNIFKTERKTKSFLYGNKMIEYITTEYYKIFPCIDWIVLVERKELDLQSPKEIIVDNNEEKIELEFDIV